VRLILAVERRPAVKKRLRDCLAEARDAFLTRLISIMSKPSAAYCTVFGLKCNQITV